MEFIETSAKTNKNVQEAFVKLASEICELKSQQIPATLTGYDPTLSLSLTTPIGAKDNSTCAC